MSRGPIYRFIVMAAVVSSFAALAADAKKKNKEPTIDDYIASLGVAPLPAEPSAPGSIFAAQGSLADMGRDLRAKMVGDMVTILISDRASAVSKGTSKSSRQSGVNASVGAFAGPTPVGGPLSALASASGQQSLNGEGETSRVSELQTTLTARVVHVLPGGNMVVEGSKLISINSERQRVTLRGVLRWNDITAGNRINSDRLANLEVAVTGKGLVNDAIRRPGFLYRLILGILPF